MLAGQGLAQVEQLRLVGPTTVTLSKAQFDSNPDGTEITFDAALATGLYSLVASQPGQSDTLPAAVLVADQVHDDQIEGALTRERNDPLRAALGGPHLVALFGEQALEEATKVRLRVDRENSRLGSQT